MTPDRSRAAVRRAPRLALTLCAALLPLVCGDTAVAQQKRAVTHDDYDKFPSLRSNSYSPDGKWMSYIVKPAVGDGVLYITEVDGELRYEFERGESVDLRICHR